MEGSDMAKRRGNDEGTIYQHKPSGLWAGQVTVGRHPISGKRVRRTVYGETQREVLELLAAEKQRPALETTRQSVAQAIDFWLAGHKTRIDPATARSYAREVGPAREYLGKLRLD